MRGLAVGFGILVLTAFGAGATELSLAMGPTHAPSTPPKPAPSATTSPKSSPSVTTTPVPSTTPAPSVSPGLPTAVTNGFVHMRAGTSTNTPIVANLNGGTVVALTGRAIGLWQPVLYNGLNGYIYTPYLNY